MRAIDENGLDEEIRCEMCKNPMHTDRGCDGNCKYDEKLYEKIIQILNKRITPLPSAQPERRLEGKWVWELDKGDPGRSMMLVCSICGSGREKVGEYNFCHICGAKMINPKGEQDE